MSNPEIGGLLLVAFILFYVVNKAPKIRALCAFVGTLLQAGWIGRAITDITEWAVHLAGTVTAWAFGTSVIAILTLVAGFFFIHDMWPKNGANKRTGWAGIALAALIMAGATGFTTLNHIGPAVQHGVTNAKQIGN